jgi:hypothetical protein
MHIVFDVVDLLQLQEIWSWRPIVAAFSRLERRETPPRPDSLRFDVAELTPRLSRLRHSPDWQQDRKADDPARVPIRDLSEAHLSQLYPETEASAVRQSLFYSAYRSFVVARYQGDVQTTGALLRVLADCRGLDANTWLDDGGQPRQGSPDWIPADITDEIRSLDARYQPAEPATPAAYVIADSFWSLLVKAEETEIEAAARQYSETETQQEQNFQELTMLVELSRVWNRSPSVVGLCYQVHPEERTS